MTLTNYEKGRAHEYSIKHKLEKAGWTVLRTAGSHGEFDLVGIKMLRADQRSHGEIVLIQAKSGKSAERERKKLEPLRAKYDGIYTVSVQIM